MEWSLGYLLNLKYFQLYDWKVVIKVVYFFFVIQKINKMNKAILAIFAILAFVPDNIDAEDAFDFKIVDKNGDGQLSVKEIATFLNKDELNDEEKEYFDTLDTSGDGFLQPEEVLPETRAFRSEEKEDTNGIFFILKHISIIYRGPRMLQIL